MTHARVGDTICSSRAAERTEPLPGYSEPVPVVYCGLFPSESTQYQLLRESIERLCLNDAALQFEPESSSAMGFGFRYTYSYCAHAYCGHTYYAHTYHRLWVSGACCHVLLLYYYCPPTTAYHYHLQPATSHPASLHLPCTAFSFSLRSCGFLGLLHMEVVQERLEREFDLDLIVTAPSVVYKVTDYLLTTLLTTC